MTKRKKFKSFSLTLLSIVECLTVLIVPVNMTYKWEDGAHSIHHVFQLIAERNAFCVGGETSSLSIGEFRVGICLFSDR